MASLASQAIPVPGYDGSFTLDQANDAEGRPSKQEFLAELAKRSATPPQALPNPLAAALARGPAAMPSAGLPNRAALASALGSSPPPAPIVPPAAASLAGAPPGTHYAQGPGEPLLLRDDQDAATAGVLSRPPGFGVNNMAPTAGLGGAAPAIQAPPATPMASPPEGRSAARGETLAGVPVPPEVANGAQYQLAKQELRAAYAGLQAEIAKGSYANEDVAKIFAAQKANAEKELYDLVKPHWSQLSEAENTALGGATFGKGQKSPEGQISRIGGTEEKQDTTPPEVLEYQFDQKNRADNGLSPQTYEQFRLAKKELVKPQLRDIGVDPEGNKVQRWEYPPGTGPSGSQSLPSSASGAGPVNDQPEQQGGAQTAAEVQQVINYARRQGISGDKLLQIMPPEIADHVRAIHDGDEPMPVTGVAGAKPVSQLINSAVRAAYPGTSAADFAARAQAKKDMAPGGKDQLMIEKLNSAVGHSMGQLAEGKALNNTLSSGLNWAEDQLYPSGTATTARIDKFLGLGNLAGPEFQSIYVPTGGAETERETHSKSMSPYMAPIDMEAVHSGRMEAVASRIRAVEHQYKKSMGPNAIPWEGLEPRTLAEVQKYANDVLPERLQAKDANGKPLAPATIDNGFKFSGGGAEARLSPEDAMKLPSGSKFIGQDGIARVKH